MAKQKTTDETLLDKCSFNECFYNRSNFCELQTIMLNEHGECIYRRNDEKAKKFMRDFREKT